MHKRGLTAATITATTVLALAVAATGDAAAAPAPAAVPSTKPTWTSHARNLGHVKSSARVSGRVYLAPRGGLAAAKQFATAVSTPGSASYGHYLTAAQYRARFQPTSTTVRTVSRYLRQSGFTVGRVGAANRFITISGSAKAAHTAFRAQLNRYRHAGHTVQAPAHALTVPASLRSSILTITGFDTSPKRMAPASKPADPPAAGYRNARPCSRYYGQIAAKYQADYKTKLPQFQGKTLPYAPCGYVGSQYRAAYEGADNTLDGSGITVAITDAYASPTITSDIATYADNQGDAPYAKGQYRESNAPAFTNQKECGASGWYGEQTLDVEAVHAMASGAKIHYYGAASCNDDDFLDALAAVVHDNDAQLVTNSWGSTESDESADSVPAYEAVFVQGAAQGISFMFSSGDNGDEVANTGLKQADYPTSDPYVTSVGGTATAIGADGSIGFQTGWGTNSAALASDGKSWGPTSYLYGAGGGSSALFNRPDYQDGATRSPYRQVPDVAMDADPQTGMLIGITQTFSDGVYYDEYRIGGTSLASPLFAGITALKLQAGAKRLGLLNPVIYKNKSQFTDVKGAPKDAGVVRVNFVNGENAKGGLSYSVRTFNQDSSLKVTTGYDQVTGVGVPNTTWFTAKAS